LLQQLIVTQKESPRSIVDSVLADIESHVAGAEQSDDITIMSFNYK
jgi:serine phosphatase RsbU (regulator of sigma subunit)